MKYQKSEETGFPAEKTLEGVFNGSIPDFQNFCQSQGVTVIVAGKLTDGQSLSLDLPVGVDVSLALKQIASQFSQVLIVSRRDANVYYVGPADEQSLISRVYRVNMKESTAFTEVVKAICSANSKVAAYADCVVVTDIPESISRLDKLYREIVSAQGQYCVEVRFVEMTESGSQELGIDWNLAGSVTLSGGVEYSRGTNKVSVSDVACVGSLDLQAMLSATESTSGVKLLQVARLHCLEGQTASVEVGEVVPVPKKTVSSEGTVTTTGYDNVSTGLVFNVWVRSEPGGLLRVFCEPELSDINGYVDYVPKKIQRKISSSAVVADGGIVVLGGFNSDSLILNDKGLPGLRTWFSRQTSKSRLFIVVRVVKAGETKSPQ